MVPRSPQGEDIIKLMAADVRIVASAGERIGQMVLKKRLRNEVWIASYLYQIACIECGKSYFDETGRDLGTKVKEP